MSPPDVRIESLAEVITRRYAGELVANIDENGKLIVEVQNSK